jgi:hypothetical protein
VAFLRLPVSFRHQHGTDLVEPFRDIPMTVVTHTVGVPLRLPHKVL